LIRAAVLTFLLAAIGVLLALPAASGLFPDLDAYRRIVLWGVPVAALLLSLALFPRLARPPGESPVGPPRRRLLLVAGCVAALLVDQSFLGIGYLTDWATFTLGAQEPADNQLLLKALSALPACLVLGIWGWERALRGAVYTGWRRRLPTPASLAFSVLTGLCLSLPVLLPGGEVRDVPFVAAAVLAVLCHELSFALVFLRGGGLLVAGLYRGLLWFLEAFVVNDWYSLWFPAYNYVAGDPLFYAFRAAAALLGLAVIVGIAGTGGDRVVAEEQATARGAGAVPGEI
jgi:hypothetical protein